MSPKLVTLTHANLKVPMDIAVALIAGWYTSPGSACTHVVASGGTIFPALETREEVSRLYTLAVQTQPETPERKP